MFNRKILLPLVILPLLSACGNQLETYGPALGSTSQESSAVEVPKSNAQLMVHNLKGALEANTSSAMVAGQRKLSIPKVSLDPSQIQAIINNVEVALASKNLLNSDDLKAIIPVLIQAASSGLGSLNLSSSETLSSILSIIGSSTIGSAMDLSSGSPDMSALISSISKNLFSSFNIAGILSGTSQKEVAATLISNILKNLNGGKFDTSALATIVQSLASGSVLGLGSITSSSAVLQALVNSLGSGSLSGLTSLIGGLGLSSGSADTVLKNLITSFVTGSNSGLAALIEKIGGSNTLVKSLLNSLLSGITGAAPGGSTSPTGSLVGNLVSGLLGSLFAKWGL